MSNPLLAVVDAFEYDLSAMRGFAFAMSCALNQDEQMPSGDEFYAMLSMIIAKLTEDKDRLKELVIG